MARGGTLVRFTLNNERGTGRHESRPTVVVQAHTVFHFVETFALVGATVATHAAGSIGIMRVLVHYEQRVRRLFGFLHNTFLQVTVVVALIVLHLIEVLWWSLFYRAHGCFPDHSTSFYFSLITYTTVGYGDVLLPRESRAIGGVEALTGVLMAGWSVAIMVWLLTLEYKRRIEVWKESQLRR
jgi:hypothetical protein